MTAPAGSQVLTAGPCLTVALRPASVVLHPHLVTAFGPVSERLGVRLTVEGDGVVGRGEALPLPAFGTGTVEELRAALEAWQAPTAPESLADICAAVESLAAVPCARFAAECALLEWLAVRRGVPVAALLDPGFSSTMASAALIEGENAASLAEAAALAVQSGFGTIKVKVGARPLTQDAQRLLAVRRAVGPTVRLRIDANGGWTEAAARAALRGLEALALELCEQPVPAHDIAALGRLRRAVPVPIAADESVALPDGPRRLLERDPEPAAQVLVLKPAALGGVLRALEVARAARSHGVACYATHLLDGALGRAAAVHLAAALGEGDLAHGLSAVEQGTARGGALVPVQGRVRLSDAAGWGV